MNGEECADYKVECHIKPAVYFDAKKVQSEAEKMRISELRSILGEKGGMKKNLVSRFVDLKRREAESSGGEPFPVKGVCNSEGCLEMTLPGGRCFDIIASKSRHPTLKRSESLKLPGPAPPELHWAMAAPKKICLCFNASDVFSGVNLPEATRLVVLDAGGLKSGREQPNEAAVAFLRAATVPMAFAAWDDGTSFPWTLAEATEDTLASFFTKWSEMRAHARKAHARGRERRPRRRRRGIIQGLPGRRPAHLHARLPGADLPRPRGVGGAGRGRRRGRRRRRDGGDGLYILRRAAGRGRSRGAGAGAPEKDFGPETLSEGQLADMFDSNLHVIFSLRAMPLRPRNFSRKIAAIAPKCSGARARGRRCAVLRVFSRMGHRCLGDDDRQFMRL